VGPVGLLTVLAAFSSRWSEAVEQLSLTLRDACGHLAVTGLREIGHGLDARVYRGESASLGPVTVRVPHARWLNSGNETQLDTRLQLRQDFDLSRHLRAHGLPVPAVFALHTDGTGIGTDFTIAQYVESDDSELPDAEFGRLVRAIHEIPAPPLDLVCMESRDDADQVLAGRIGDRLKNLAAVTELDVRFPDIRTALAADRGDSLLRRLLHMDLRRENILVRAGRPVAILDWSNALIGDPALDLARAAEYGSLTPAALAGYGDPGRFTPLTPLTPLTSLTPRQAVYRLDTTVMLSHVFLDGAADPAKARHYLERTKSLCRRLTDG
jgi:phosphotransferase family enzyme